MEETGGGRGREKKKRKIAPPLIGRKNCPSDEKLFKERKMQWLRKDKCDSFIFESIFIRGFCRVRTRRGRSGKRSGRTVFQLTKAGCLSLRRRSIANSLIQIEKKIEEIYIYIYIRERPNRFNKNILDFSPCLIYKTRQK